MSWSVPLEPFDPKRHRVTPDESEFGAPFPMVATTTLERFDNNGIAWRSRVTPFPIRIGFALMCGALVALIAEFAPESNVSTDADWTAIGKVAAGVAVVVGLVAEFVVLWFRFAGVRAWAISFSPPRRVREMSDGTIETIDLDPTKPIAAVVETGPWSSHRARRSSAATEDRGCVLIARAFTNDGKQVELTRWHRREHTNVTLRRGGLYAFAEWVRAGIGAPSVSCMEFSRDSASFDYEDAHSMKARKRRRRNGPFLSRRRHTSPIVGRVLALIALLAAMTTVIFFFERRIGYGAASLLTTVVATITAAMVGIRDPYGEDN
jgi:hypothetical protein